MEIKFNRTYIPKGKKYTVGEIAVMYGCAMEIVDMRPLLAEGKLAPGELCMMLFGLTKEEYGWKDGDPKKLDALCERLRKELPADRLIGVQVRDLKGSAVQRQVKLRTSLSMDGGEFAKNLKTAAPENGPLDSELLECRKLQQLCADKNAPEGVKEDWRSARTALGEKLAELDTLYAAYDPSLNGRFPAVDFNGRIDVFTVRARAERMRTLIEKINGGVSAWEIREFSGSEKESFFRTCEMLGILELQIDNGFAGARLRISDFRAEELPENAELRRCMLCEMEYGLRWNRLQEADAPEKIRRGALEGMLTFRNFAQRGIGNAVLYAVCDAPHAGHGNLATPAALAKLGGGTQLRINGGEKAVMLGRRDSDEKYLAVFSTEIQAAAFSEKVNVNARPVAMTFDDLAQRSGAAAGMLIDPDGLGYRLLKQDYEKVRDLRGKAPVIVRVKPPEDEAPVPDPDTGIPAAEEKHDFSLPDPDACGVPEAAKPEPKAEPAAEQAETGRRDEPGNKGFFKRIFGK